MESLSNNEVFSFHPNTLDVVRKVHGFKSQKEMNEAIDILETWAKQQEHFVRNDFDRDYLERVIISCKGSIERTKKQIDKVCTMRTILPHYFEDFDVRTINPILLDPNEVALAISRTLTKDHNRIVLVRHGLKSFPFEIQKGVNKLTLLITNYIKCMDYADSYCLIVDYTHGSVSSVVTQCDISEAMKFTETILHGFGLRVKGVHIICTSPLIEGLVKIFKLGMPKKLHDRIHVHRKYDSLKDHLEVEVLPKEYGGQAGNTADIYAKCLEAVNSEEFREQRRKMYKFCTDETKRSTDTFNDQYMGMPGTFRTLSVD